MSVDVRFHRETADKGLARALAGGTLEAAAARCVAGVLRHEKARVKGVLNVIWSTPARVKALNKRFRQTDRDTDVIAFRYEEPAPGGELPFGDLYINPAQARYNARRFGAAFDEELLRLVTHGTLHLLGHTDYEPGPKKKMWDAQEAVLRRVLRS